MQVFLRDTTVPLVHDDVPVRVELEPLVTLSALTNQLASVDDGPYRLLGRVLPAAVFAVVDSHGRQ